MSVYRKKRNGTQEEFFSYSFRLNGHRFSGNTGETNERKAIAWEKAKRQEVLISLKSEGPVSSHWTFGKALTAYFEEKMNGRLDDNSKPIMVWLQENVGNNTQLKAINTAFVASLIKKRSTDPGVKSGTSVSNATINRTVTEPLRRILRYVSEVHDQRSGKVLWKELLKKEPRERVRELRNDEEHDIFSGMREDYKPIIEFCLLSGLRLNELVSLRWENVDFLSRKIWLTRKGGELKSVPLATSLEEILKHLKGHHSEYVFTFVCQRTTRNPKTKQFYKAGHRYPISYYGLKSTWARIRKTSGVKDFRFHDFRHTAASRVLRATGNLKIVQELLGHEEIETTLRYAHVMNDDVANGVDKAATMNRRTTIKRKVTPIQKVSPELSPQIDEIDKSAIK